MYLDSFALFFSHLFFFNDTATTEIYTLSLHDALPIFRALESAWFAASGTRDRSITGGRTAEMATAEAAPRPAAAGRAPWPEQRTAERHPAEVHAAAQARQAGQNAPAGGRSDYYDTTGGSQMAGSTASTGRGAEQSWHTNADEGWSAAAAAAEPV